jgi:tRNA(adenine34) deaminase
VAVGHLLDHPRYLDSALHLAEEALDSDNFPVGAVLVAPDGSILASGRNRSQEDRSCTSHAELEAIRAGGALLSAPRNAGSALYTSGEPCLMCLGAVFQCGALTTLVWAAGPVSPAGSAHAAIRQVGFNPGRLATLQVVAEPSEPHRLRSRELLTRYLLSHPDDPRARWLSRTAAD